MKGFLKIVIVIMFLAVSSFAEDTPPSSEKMVFIVTSGNGTRYHIKDCRTIQKSEKTEVTIEAAKQRGFTPCSVCKPGD